MARAKERVNRSPVFKRFRITTPSDFLDSDPHRGGDAMELGKRPVAFDGERYLAAGHDSQTAEVARHRPDAPDARLEGAVGFGWRLLSLGHRFEHLEARVEVVLSGRQQRCSRFGTTTMSQEDVERHVVVAVGGRVDPSAFDRIRVGETLDAARAIEEGPPPVCPGRLVAVAETDASGKRNAAAADPLQKWPPAGRC